MNKKILLFSLLVILLTLPFVAQAQDKEKVIFYYGYTCPHCDKAEEYMEKVNLEDKVNIEKREVYLNSQNAARFNQFCEQADIPNNERGVPMLIWGSQYAVGDTPIINFIDYKLEELENTNINNQTNTAVNNNQNENTNQALHIEKKYNLPFFGQVDLTKYSLPVLTLIIGAVDGFNPCAMWVLVFLISALLGMKNRKNMWAIGLTFIAASALVYFLFMTAWLNLFLFIGYVRIVQIIIGVLALGVGFYYLKEFIQKRSEECKVVKGERRQKVMDKINNIVESRNFIYALGGIVVLAFVVNLIELACSVGLPAIYTQILALSNLPKWQYYLYIAGYTIIFMLDDMIIFTVAMLTVKVTGLTGKYSRFSELIGGIIIFILGILLLIKPEWLMFA
ncbi:MAG: hypothetical protein U5L76_05235 [Patescibacteria group bacterium]|nr:hypothetical protein [Patescibacteria group bacterium]